jgi:hypothetical protein
MGVQAGSLDISAALPTFGWPIEPVPGQYSMTVAMSRARERVKVLRLMDQCSYWSDLIEREVGPIEDFDAEAGTVHVELLRPADIAAAVGAAGIAAVLRAVRLPTSPDD